MSISLIVSAIGAVVAAIGSGVLLARCFRAPRGDVIAWSVALLGLLVSLGSQTLGHLVGFDGAMFRAMELGGQVIAPLALILALSEVAGRSTAARFCARLYIPALGIVAFVVLALDQLADVPFTKAWPDPAVYYQTPPDYVLMFAIGPATALVTIITVAVVLVRSGQPGWNAVLPAQLMGGAAALFLAYPPLQQLAAYLAGVHLPIKSEFSLLCTAAAALAWLAGTRTGQIRLSALRGTSGRARARDAADQWHGVDQTGDVDRFEAGADQGLYRGGGLYRSAPHDDNATSGYGRDQDDPGYGGWQDDRAADGYGDDWGGAAGRLDDDRGYQADPRDGYQYDRQGYRPGDDESADYSTGDFATAEGYQGTEDSYSASNSYPASDWRSADSASRPGADDAPAYGDGPRPGQWQSASEQGRFGAGQDPGGDDVSRTQLLGQIAIYTLLEDRVTEFDQLTERVVEQVRSNEPDTLVYIVHAVPSAPMQRILYEVYRNREAYERHGRQPYVIHFEADRRPYVLATNVIELGLQQAKVSPFPSVTELFGEPGYDTSGFERPDYLRDYGRTSARPGGGAREYR
jgi:quinol monooxygenase YgiN